MADAVVEVARKLGIELARWDLPGGDRTTNHGRTWLTTATDGAELVVKWSMEPSWGAWIPNVVGFTEELIGRGYPCPRTVAHGPVGDLGYGWIQQRLPGAPCTGGLTSMLLDQVLGAIETQADATVETQPDWSWVHAVVFDDFAGWWANARSLDADAVELCDRLRTWVDEVDRPSIRSDYVHLDLNFSNILAVGDRLTGIVDTDHLGVGDRSVDVAGLAYQFAGRFYDTGEAVPEGLMDRLAGIARSISGEGGWRLAVAYHGISWLGWSAPDGFRTEVDRAKTTVRWMIEGLPNAR